jgi:aryl-alcohol dehydrogenase-like predicted oxidoreductase
MNTTTTTRTLGRTDIEVSPLCLGGNVFGWNVDRSRSFEVLDAFVDGGGNFIDTADVYSSWAEGNSGGESETIIGEWLAARSLAGKVVVATKVGLKMGDGDMGLSRGHILMSAVASARRLGVDAIDLYYAHRDDPDVPLEETFGTFHELTQTGLVRAVGVSNYTAERLAEVLEVCDREGFERPQVFQPHYNLVHRAEYEGGLMDLCVREQISVAPYLGLAAGFLTGKYQHRGKRPDSARADGMPARLSTGAGFTVVDALREVAGQHRATPAQAALAWLAAQPGVVAPIASATSATQVRDTSAFAAVQLTDADLERLGEVSLPFA